MNLTPRPALERIHDPHAGFTATDFGQLKPNTVMLEPVDGPEYLGKIIVPGTSLGPAACRVLYRVVAAGKHMSICLAPGESSPIVKVGDVVVPRNGMFDPVGPNLFSCGMQHILAIIDPEVFEPDAEIGAPIEGAANDEPRCVCAVTGVA